MTRVYVSIGSNVEPERYVAHALDALRQHFGVIEVSPVYRAAAIGFDGDDFLNLVVGFETELSVDAVDAALDAIEVAAGRNRDQRRFAPRTLDLDLLLYGDAVVERDGITVPRKELLRYAFMLKPLADIAADVRHPVLGETMRELLRKQDFGGQRCERTDLCEPDHSYLI